MSKSEIEKIKAILAEMNSAYDYDVVEVVNSFRNLTKALDIAVDFIHVNELEYRDEFMDQAADNCIKILKHIKETLQNDA